MNGDSKKEDAKKPSKKKGSAQEAYEKLEKTVNDKITGLETKIGKIEEGLTELTKFSEEIHGLRDAVGHLTPQKEIELCPECGFKKESAEQPPPSEEKIEGEEGDEKIRVKIVDQ